MTNESNNNAQEEMDLILLFNKAGTLFLKIILFFFRGIKEILLVWKKLAAVIILGAVLGYIVENITEKTSSKEASILLRINFDAGNFVYDAINLINQKIETEDEQFFISDLKYNEDGFIINDFAKGGMFAAGCANKPADVVTSNQNATGMALKAIQTLVRR